MNRYNKIFKQIESENMEASELNAALTDAYCRLDDYKILLQELLKVLPNYLHCGHFHHDRKHYHKFEEPCKPLENYNQMVNDIQLLLDKWVDPV